jgi:TonB family protein
MVRQYYLWAAGGATVTAAFAPDVIDRLRQAAETVDSAEIGGILLGRRESEDRIFIEDFELLESEHRRGVTFTLSQTDRKKLGQRLGASHHGLQSVGSFRTHLRQGLYMDQYDFELMSMHFAASTDVMLLIRPSDWQAGVFVWEEGDIHRQKSYREFTFAAAVLPLTAVVDEARTAARLQPSLLTVVPRTARPKVSGPFMPTLAKVGLVAATIGLVGVLAFYAHEHRIPVSTVAKADFPAIQALTLPAKNVRPPIDPDLSPRDDLSEMHVKIPTDDTRPSPFGSPPHVSQVDSEAADSTPRAKSIPQQHAEAVPEATPTQPPTVQAAVNLPPAITGPLTLKPPPLPVVSVVSLEPAEPGMLSRGINRVPVLNLLQRHKYKAGEKFSPAVPVRQVKPRLPAEVEHESHSPSPVDVKVWIDKSGQVTKAELLSDNTQPEVADITSNAALKWTFEPARISDRPVASEMVMHFRFTQKQSY